jgi:hypothetical protein
MNIEKKEKVIIEIFQETLIGIEERIENHSYPKSVMAIYAKAL